ncbi:type II toxin-antitoxin system RelE/ParE family toxin [Mangrovibacterium diazotrophicum]|uniref:Plasmid stabilization system protein ParE n=1 Tax=Mangrovibacterium diazotrophicum TaxID=1261403 RepID=A0A419W6F6_9BACT|nr:type II toxin-antitoxin system RelE/ParE family toxin [Mangrovibacterium diazotrophicum]RKD91048.1 plasmid stabilization system protein ParE [Mangrovibacterium diazotrophicum]
MAYKLRWSAESIRNLEEVINDIQQKWSDKEVRGFKQKLGRQLNLIIRFPTLFPVSLSNPNLRKAVLSKQTTVFYQITNNTIYLVHIHLNRKNQIE